MKNGWLKKVGLIAGIVASFIIIGTSVHGWVNKDNTEEKTDTETQACIEYVIGA